MHRSIKERDPNRRRIHEIGSKNRVTNDPLFRWVHIDSVLIADYLIGSRFEEATALVMLSKNEFISAPTLSDEFRIHNKTINSYISTYNVNGLECLRPAAHYPEKVNNDLVDFIQKEQLNNTHLTLTMLN